MIIAWALPMMLFMFVVDRALGYIETNRYSWGGETTQPKAV